MLGEGGTPLSKLMSAIREFAACEDRPINNEGLRVAIDALEGEFCADARRSQLNGEHLVNGNVTAPSWIARTCNMSVHSAADRLCVGAQLEELPKIKEARGSGDVGCQPAGTLSR